MTTHHYFAWSQYNKDYCYLFQILILSHKLKMNTVAFYRGTMIQRCELDETSHQRFWRRFRQSY